MKRSTRRRLTQGILYAVFAAVILFILLSADWGRIQPYFFNLGVARETFPEILTVAAKNTVIYTAIAFVGGMLFGLLLALMKLSPVLPYRWLATGYIELFRGLPALLVIFGFAFAVPIAFQWQAPGGSVGAGLIGLIVVSAAYIAETIRAGIEAVPKGQVEAARSLGMNSVWTMITVVLPQAFRIITPPLTNELVILIKDTSLLFIAGMAIADRDLTTFARDSLTNQANATPLVVAALLYLVITLPLTQLVAKLEQHNKRGR
ncbi:amino acid ABC transporter permease [Arthrobacter agilis]|uniref:amino acid ABC transporter permease n=1 Tax=Arthrobacter agilis TaxID=37921 RepID=UPI000B35A2BA|nr:amino acid ABC transporter permease [Arthrobacter agilis]OUM42940.1 ABC transporter permease [Arthrobacter agilis]PPB45886.1 amino acid ABC transporter permease [Arthrobacter agilis]TPV25427.1 amino acid ABC transporter permease [Arthrobacter agilis]VDR33165.1 Inner membrane amino-acid ABC transporter permease protein yecS [Arthrobacter agilis]